MISMTILLTVLSVGFIISTIYFLGIRPAQTIERWAASLSNGGVFPSKPTVGPLYWLLPVHRELAAVKRRMEQLKEKAAAGDDELRQAEFFHQLILASVFEGIMVVDDARRITLVNAEFMNLFQLTQSPLQRKLMEVLRDASVEGLVRTAYETNKPQTTRIERQLRGRQGRLRHFEVSAIPMRPRDGTTQAVVVLFNDVTRMRELEDVRAVFAENMADELRTPLSIFQGYVETLLSQPNLPAADRNMALQKIRTNAQRLGTLVNELLLLTQASKKTIKLELQDIPLHGFLTGIVEGYQVGTGSLEVGFDVEVEAGTPPLQGDRERLQLVLLNLVENAVQYSPGEKYVHLWAGVENESLLIRVRDRGIGIDATELPHIFDRFYRSQEARNQVRSGSSGLGLAIVKEIVELHGGSVAAESSTDKGTTVTLSFPLAGTSPQQPRPRSRARSQMLEARRGMGG